MTTFNLPSRNGLSICFDAVARADFLARQKVGADFLLRGYPSGATALKSLLDHRRKGGTKYKRNTSEKITVSRTIKD